MSYDHPEEDYYLMLDDRFNKLMEDALACAEFTVQVFADSPESRDLALLARAKYVIDYMKEGEKK